MKKGKIERILYGIWLAILGCMLVICSLENCPVLIDGTVRTLCFGLLGMPVLLFLIPDKTAKLHYRLLQLTAFGTAAVLYWVYCFRLDDLISTNSTMDALVAGGLLCAASMAAGRRSTERSETES